MTVDECYNLKTRNLQVRVTVDAHIGWRTQRKAVKWRSSRCLLTFIWTNQTLLALPTWSYICEKVLPISQRICLIVVKRKFTVDQTVRLKWRNFWFTINTINIRTEHSGKSLTNQRVGKWNGCIKSWYSIASICGAVISMNKLSIVTRKSYIGRVWGVTKRLLYA